VYAVHHHVPKQRTEPMPCIPVTCIHPERATKHIFTQTDNLLATAVSMPCVLHACAASVQLPAWTPPSQGMQTPQLAHAPELVSSDKDTIQTCMVQFCKHAQCTSR
jgi:hypothetical protein